VDTNDHHQLDVNWRPFTISNKVIRCLHLMTSGQPVTIFLSQTGYLGTLLIKQDDAHSSSLDFAAGDLSNQLRVLYSLKRSHTANNILKWTNGNSVLFVSNLTQL